MNFVLKTILFFRLEKNSESENSGSINVKVHIGEFNDLSKEKTSKKIAPELSETSVKTNFFDTPRSLVDKNL